MDGFDTKSPLVCEGIIGDGCGGGRIFHIRDEKLFAYDPQSKTEIQIQSNILNANKISKNGCIVSVVCLKQTLSIDLSKIG